MFMQFTVCMCMCHQRKQFASSAFSLLCECTALCAALHPVHCEQAVNCVQAVHAFHCMHTVHCVHAVHGVQAVHEDSVCRSVH